MKTITLYELQEKLYLLLCLKPDKAICVDHEGILFTSNDPDYIARRILAPNSFPKFPDKIPDFHWIYGDGVCDGQYEEFQFNLTYDKVFKYSMTYLEILSKIKAFVNSGFQDCVLKYKALTGIKVNPKPRLKIAPSGWRL